MAGYLSRIFMISCKIALFMKTVTWNTCKKQTAILLQDDNCILNDKIRSVFRYEPSHVDISEKLGNFLCYWSQNHAVADSSTWLKDSSRYTFHYRKSITVNVLSKASRARQRNRAVSGGCPISSMVTVNIYVQRLYRELNWYRKNYAWLVNS